MINPRTTEVGSAGHVATHRYFRFLLLWLIGIIFLNFATPLFASAITPISQSYITSELLSLGSIVSLKSSTSDQVVAANNTNIDGILGVVINADSSIISISGSGASQVQVATSGTLQLLVSDINGPIIKGDYITASPINGVGMKATSSVRIIGIAQGDLNSSTGSQQSYTDKDGVSHSVLVGQIPIVVNVSYYTKEPEKTLVPPALQNIANSLAGKPVSTLPILISAGIFIIMLIVVVSIIYTMIRSSIISVGRNPMAQSAVYRDLIQLSGLVLVILAVGVIAIYLILTRM